MTHSWFAQRDKCPACHAETFQQIYATPYDSSPVLDYLENFYPPQGIFEPEYIQGAEYVLLACRNCNLVFQQYIPNDDFTLRLYEHWISPSHSLAQENLSAPKAAYHRQEMMQFLAYLDTPPAQTDVLDFGMGWGAWAQTAQTFGCQVVGYEISPARIAHAAANGIPTVSWEDIAQRQFDLIHTEQVFEHLPAPLDTLRYLAASLKPNGLIKISVPDFTRPTPYLNLTDWRPTPGVRNPVEPIAPLEHLNAFPRSALIEMGRTANLVEVFMPLKIQYAHTTDWRSPMKALRNILRPIKLNYLKTQNYVFFQKHPGE